MHNTGVITAIVPLVTLFEKFGIAYYIDEEMIRDAIKHRSSFNIIFLETMLKIDIFLPKQRSFDLEEYRRAQPEILIEGVQPFYIASPEDTVLHKLEWYKMGNEISDRQWNDILGVLKVRGKTLDATYLQEWAERLGVIELLRRAYKEAGLADLS